MRKIIVAAVCCAVLASGCAMSAKRYQRSCKSWLGQSSDRLFEVRGFPDEIREYGGMVAYSYYVGRADGGYGYQCKTVFVADRATGTIKSYQTDGVCVEWVGFR